MKSLYLSLIAVALLFTACKKENSEPSKPITYASPDFALIPTKDAKWYVHIITDENYCYEYRDPADAVIAELKGQMANHYYVIETTGIDSVIGGKIYHRYKITETIVPPDNIPSTRSYPYFLREDISAGKVYSGYDKNEEYNKSFVVLDFSDEVNQGQVTPFPTWPVMSVSAPEGIVLNGQKFRSWNMQNIQDHKVDYFYKAIGIGSATGILDYKTGEISVWQTVSLDFVYKGDSIHFDYPLQ